MYAVQSAEYDACQGNKDVQALNLNKKNQEYILLAQRIQYFDTLWSRPIVVGLT